MTIQNKYEEILSPIKSRLYEYLDSKNIRKGDFFEKTSISSSNFRGKSAKSELGGDKIAKILSIYTDINAQWFLTGIGDKTNPKGWKNLEIDGNTVNETGVLIPINEIGVKKVPLVHRHAYTQFINQYEKGKELQLLSQANWNLEDFEPNNNFLAFEQIGDSMRDESRLGIMDGDYLLGKHIQKESWIDEINGQNFAVLHKLKGILIRQLKFDLNNDTVIHCLTKNEKYEDSKINTSEIIELYKIVKLKRDFRD